jgi:fatty-acyl-CoA synthase
VREGTLPWHLANTAAKAPPEDRLVFVDRHEQESGLHWSEVYARARRSAGALAAAGVGPGDRVAIVLPTCQEFLDALFGCQLLGAIPAPLYPPVRLGRLDEYYAKTGAMLEAIEAAALVTSGRVKRVLGQVLPIYSPPLGLIDASSLASGAERESALVDQDALALIQFSSGTTVSPKPVALSHRQVLANVRAILDHIPVDAGFKQSGVSWLPLYHDMGLIGCVFVAVVGPGPLVLLPPEQFLAKPALWLRAIARHRATVSPAPNFAFALCTERIADEELDGVDLSSWRLALSGAEPIAASCLREFNGRFERWGLRPQALTPVYGLSEAALAVTFSDPVLPFSSGLFDRTALGNGEARLVGDGDDGFEMVCVGRPLSGFRVAIRDDASTLLSEGLIGTIWVRGPSVMTGYLDREEQPIVDGWLNTGDLGFLLNGGLYVSGRLKDVVILRGQNHHPHDIERSVDHLDGVRTGCAVAVSDLSASGEQLLVFVEVRQMRENLAEDCRKAIRSRAGLDPDLVVLLKPGTLPRTSSGKLRRRAALAAWKAGTLCPPNRVTPLLLAGAMAKSGLGFLQARLKSKS